MSLEQNKAIVLQFYKAFSQGNLEQAREMIAPNIVVHTRGSVMRGSDDFFEHVQMVHSTFPDGYVTIEDVIAEDDKVVTRGTFTGTRCREFLVYSVVAEMAGQIVGSNFLWEESTIAGVGPITIVLHIQNATLGRRLMEAVLERAQQQGFVGVRLVQAAFHNRSLSLYTKLGFDVQEPLANLQGPALGLEIPGYAVRPATEEDLAACNRLCRQVHGFERGRELLQSIQKGTATVVEFDARITGYATLIGFFGHAVGESNEDLKALIGAAKSFEGSGFLLPTRNSQLFRWCLHHGLRVVQPMTLMSLGLYNQPAGAFLPSITF